MVQFTEEQESLFAIYKSLYENGAPEAEIEKAQQAWLDLLPNREDEDEDEPEKPTPTKAKRAKWAKALRSVLNEMKEYDADDLSDELECVIDEITD